MSRNGAPEGKDGRQKDDRQNEAVVPGRDDSVRTEILLSHTLLPVEQPGVFWALVTLTGVRPRAAAQGAAGQERLPLNIGLVLDRSGSMEASLSSM